MEEIDNWDDCETQHALEDTYADEDTSPNVDYNFGLEDEDYKSDFDGFIQTTTLPSVTNSSHNFVASNQFSLDNHRLSTLVIDEKLNEFVEMNKEVWQIQSLLQNNFENAHSSHYLRSERNKMKRSLDYAFKLKLSTSVIIIDPTGCGKSILIDDVLSAYNLSSSTSNSSSGVNRQYIGVVSGMLIENESEAISCLAGQFLIRSKTESQMILALEDLQTHFAQCKIEGRPAVIILEDLERFANQKRQSVMYTLLDLMHDKDLLFIMIGITGRADVQYKLEKRVLSRLNAQYVYLSHATAEDVARDLYNRFILPATANSSGVVSEQSRVRFNKHIVSLFGKYKDSDAHVTLSSSTIVSESSSSGILTELSPPVENHNETSFIVNNDIISSSLSSFSHKEVYLEATLKTNLEVNLKVEVELVPSLETSCATTSESQVSRSGEEEREGSSELTSGTEDFNVSQASVDNSQIVDGMHSPVTSVRTRSASSVDRNGVLSPRVVVSTRSQSLDLASSASRKVSAKRKLSVSDDFEALAVRDGETKKTALQLKYEAEQAEAEILAAAEQASKDLDDSQCKLERAGSLLDTIRTRREWGQGIEYFSRVASAAVQMLSADSPVVTKELFLSALTDSEPPTMAERMAQLPELELYLLASLTYMHLHCPALEHFSVGQMVVEYDKMTSGLRDKRVQKIRVVEAVYHLCASRFICLYNHQTGRRSVLEAGVTGITSQTVVFLAVSLRDVQESFLNKQSEAVQRDERRRSGVGRVQPTIAMSESARRLIKVPHSVNLYQSAGAQSARDFIMS